MSSGAITREQRLSALRHDDFFVRSIMLGTFSEDLDSDPEVAKQAIVTIEKHGWDDGFEYSHQLKDLAQDKDTVEWAMSRILDKQLPVRSNRNVPPAIHLLNWVSHAPVGLLEPFLQRLDESPEAKIENDFFEGRSPLPSKLEIARHRIDLAGLNASQCFEQLEETLAACHDPESKEFPHGEAARLTRICERLGELGEPDDAQLLEWLDHDPDSDPSINDWRAGAAIQIAGFGKRTTQEVSERLIDFYDIDWDWTNEQVALAFQRSGCETGLRTIIERYPHLDWHARLYLSSVLEKLRFPEMEAAVTGLLDQEDEDDLRCNLGIALVRYASPASLELAEQIIKEEPRDPERFHIAEHLYAYATMLGEERPELEIWKKQMESMRPQISDFSFSSLPRVPKPNPFKGVGRNAPCPCGSGKKFKKCCLLTAN